MAINASLNTPYLVLSGTVIVAIVIAFTVIQPMVADISTIKADIQTASTTLAEREAFLKTVDRKIAQLRAQQEHAKRLDTILPTSQRFEDVLRILHEASANSGIVISEVTDSSRSFEASINAQRNRGEDVPVPESVVPLQYSMQLTGSYQQFRAFLKELETSPRVMDVVQIDLQRPDDQPDILAATIVVRYFAQENQEESEQSTQ